MVRLENESVTPGGEASNLKGRQGQRKLQGICFCHFSEKLNEVLGAPAPQGEVQVHRMTMTTRGKAERTRT